MYIADLFRLMEQDDFDRNEAEHEEALRQTGYWGKQAAGSIFLARDTRRFLIAHRSSEVKEGGTWGTWGGAIDDGEDPKTAAQREAAEEAGSTDHVTLIPLYVFRDKKFRYSNFLAVVDHEFRPVLNWETQGYEWCEWGKWPQPLHFGLRAVFNHPKSVATIRKTLAQLA